MAERGLLSKERTTPKKRASWVLVPLAAKGWDLHPVQPRTFGFILSFFLRADNLEQAGIRFDLDVLADLQLLFSEELQPRRKRWTVHK